MSMATGAKLQLEPGSWAETFYDVYIGIVVGAAHSAKLISKWWYNHFILPVKHAIMPAVVNSNNNNSNSDKNAELKVVAVGYGRTGTYSLTLALEELGFPTLHTQHFYEHDKILKMWSELIFQPSIKQQKTIMGEPDLHLIAQHGYQATADLPMALYFEQVMHQFPNCKFILTTRENSNVWFKSWDTLTKSIAPQTHRGGFFFTGVRHYEYYLRWLFSVINKDESYLTMPFPLADQNKDAAIASYEEHNRRVRQTIPADRLLEYNVQQGWTPLCDFLQIDACPSTPFPKTNSARSVQVQALSAFFFPLVCVLFCLFYGFAKLFRRATGMTLLQWANWKSRELTFTMRKVLLMSSSANHHEKAMEDDWEAPRKKC